jgi:hypothetical protein
MMAGLLLAMVLSVCTCWFHNMVTLPTWLVSTDFVHVRTRVHCLILPLVPYIYWSVVEHTVYHVAWCIVLLPTLGTLT